MYDLIYELLSIPTNQSSNYNSTVIYITGTVLILFVTLIIDLLYKFFRHIIKIIEN